MPPHRQREANGTGAAIGLRTGIKEGSQRQRIIGESHNSRLGMRGTITRG